MKYPAWYTRRSLKMSKGDQRHVQTLHIMAHLHFLNLTPLTRILAGFLTIVPFTVLMRTYIFQIEIPVVHGRDSNLRYSDRKSTRLLITSNKKINVKSLKL